MKPAQKSTLVQPATDQTTWRLFVKSSMLWGKVCPPMTEVILVDPPPIPRMYGWSAR